MKATKKCFILVGYAVRKIVNFITVESKITLVLSQPTIAKAERSKSTVRFSCKISLKTEKLLTYLPFFISLRLQTYAICGLNIEGCAGMVLHKSLL